MRDPEIPEVTPSSLRSAAGELLAIVARRMIYADTEEGARIVRLLQAAAEASPTCPICGEACEAYVGASPTEEGARDE